MMRILIVFLIVSFSWVSFSQASGQEPGKVTITRPSSVEKLISFKATTVPPNIGPVMDGYRVQLFFDQSRTEVDKAKARVLAINNKIPTYIEYNAPNYLLLAGDFRTQIEAEKLRGDLIYEFPEAIIKEMQVYFPAIKEVKPKKEEVEKE